MSNREASRTALATAFMRAAHQILDAKPLVFEDAVAVQLLGKDASQRISEAAERYQTPGARALRSHIVLRSRYAEDQLQATAQRGISQYVILGAGFDTFVLRQPRWANDLKIVEVDHPETQSLKYLRIADASLSVPENVTFAGIDFEIESLDEGLRRNGISIAERTFFCWLGVTMYLTIKTPFDVWMDIMTGKADGQQMFMEQKYTVTGDIGLMIQLFKTEGDP